MQKIIYTKYHIQKGVEQLLQNCSSKTLCCYGEMGSGKTTLIKALVRELGGGDQGNSPSYGLVNEYYTKGGELLGYHFDFYRLEEETEALDIGLEDYLDQEAWIFMEWPGKIPSLLPEHRTEIYITVLSNETRELRIKNY